MCQLNWVCEHWQAYQRACIMFLAEIAAHSASSMLCMWIASSMLEIFILFLNPHIDKRLRQQQSSFVCSHWVSISTQCLHICALRHFFAHGSTLWPLRVLQLWHLCLKIREVVFAHMILWSMHAFFKCRVCCTCKTDHWDLRLVSCLDCFEVFEL